MFGSNKTKVKASSGHFDTLISSKTSLQGDVSFSGGLHIDGRIEGSVRAEEGSDAVLRISEVGEVEGDVHAPRIVINGTVHGNVYATEHLELASKAAINGNVYYNLIEMAMGAAVNGSLLHRKGNQEVPKPQARLTGHYDQGAEQTSADADQSDEEVPPAERI
ncbi:MAG: polymer-forming cytoskeletal protein [Halomonadaceae bacterium]|nr:MAG: polymer-forming cytoskeletal protein [Halomonadaceae bacterium]